MNRVDAVRELAQQVKQKQDELSDLVQRRNLEISHAHKEGLSLRQLSETTGGILSKPAVALIVRKTEI